MRVYVSYLLLGPFRNGLRRAFEALSCATHRVGAIHEVMESSKRSAAVWSCCRADRPNSLESSRAHSTRPWIFVVSQDTLANPDLIKGRVDV